MNRPIYFGLLLLGSGLAVASPAGGVSRPVIWATTADRPAILAKIESQPWARTVFDAMRDRVRESVAEHQKDPDAYLRGLPLIFHPAEPGRHPTLARIGGGDGPHSGGSRGHSLQRYLQVGTDCSVLYYLTQDEAYGRCAADILHACIEAMVQMKRNDSSIHGGFIYYNDVCYDARAVGAQLPVIHDFLHGRLRAGGTVYDLVAKGPASFNFAHAEKVFRDYALMIIEQGIVNNNHPVLEMPCLALNVLALDDAGERERLLEYVTVKDAPRQDSLKKVMAVYPESGGVWPECFQYSYGVSARVTCLVALLQRQHPPAIDTKDCASVTLSMTRLRELRFPNGENIQFGDGPRKSGEPCGSYEIAYALALREGDGALQRKFGGLINLAIQQGKYDRAATHGYVSGADAYQGPIQLLWYAPEVVGEMEAPVPKTTDELPFVGAVLQRNLVSGGNPADALMAVVSGGSHVHSHASGMSLELYGAGQVLGVHGGKGNYGSDEHENYRRLFAAHNCVIVNGASRSEGAWVNLGINTVQKVAVEPAVGAPPVSANHSFTLTSFADDKGPGAKAKQERLVGIVRTSATTGYYVDVFRSESALPNQFHDYLYHNLGDGLTLASAAGPLALADSPGRFVPVKDAVWNKNRTFLYPGWHFFKQAKTSAPFADDVTVDFSAAKLSPAPAHMRLFIPGAPDREYSSALAPATKDAPGGYDKELTPVLVVRQQGEAWTRPFAVIYEPSTGDGKSGSIQSVTALDTNGAFAGFKIVSRVDGKALMQYVLVQPTAASVYENAALGISFCGRYAVITANERGDCTALYLGEGERLRFQGHDLHAQSKTTVAASATIDGDTAKVTATIPAELTLPSGRRVSSNPPMLLSKSE